MRKTKLLPHAFAVFLAVLLAVVPVLTAQKNEKTEGRLVVSSVGIDPEKIRAQVKFLASDFLEGRGMGQRGGDLAAEYIATQFALEGLKPAGENGTYFQTVPMVGVKTLPGTTFALAPNSGEAIAMKNLDDFVTSNETQTESAEIDAPIVFVGYGIKAPEYNWDDFKGYDLHGKVALLFVNEPVSDDPKFFKGKALTYYGRWTYKFEETARRGAVATLIIHRTDLASYGWQVVRNSWGSEKSYLKLDGTPKLKAASWIHLEVAKKLAALAGMDVDKMFAQAQSRDFKPVELPVRLKAQVASQLRPFDSRNVLAMKPGGDAQLKDQAVMYTAHYDHFGIDPNLKADDKIYNGAVDNATGCGVLLELARTWAALPGTARRTILFAAVTAEEQGLLGSEYLGKHSPVPPGKVTLDLNYDALAPIGDPEEVEVSGAERTTFYPVVESVAKVFGLQIRADAHPEAGHYYRSDHFSLARVGIPSFSISEGLKFKGHDEAWGEEQAKDYVERHYHQTSDEYRETWDFTGLAKMGMFGYELGMQAASQPEVIGWVPGDEFEAARKKSQVSTPIGSSLFDYLPALRVAHYEPMHYPPLAAQVRAAGKVELHVAVDRAGAVTDVTVLSGHPLLTSGAKDNMQRWKFEPLESSGTEFDITYEFDIRETAELDRHEQIYFPHPGRILVVVSPPIPQTSFSSKSD
jgi:TonB family protein